MINTPDSKQELHIECDELKKEIKALRDELRDFMKWMDEKLDQVQKSIINGVTFRILICQIATAIILIGLMIFFHQKP
jgi:hypothetical protein